MDHFDKLIKEKIESKTYEYKNSYWKSFTKKANFSHSISTLKIAILSITVATFLGTAVFLWRQEKSENEKQETRNQKENEIIKKEKESITCEQKATDTIGKATEETILPEISSKKEHHVKKSEYSNKVSRSKQIDSSTQIGSTAPAPKSKTRVNRKSTSPKKSNWRILTIDPDTIKSNEFPDYPTKSAEVLP
ncbi:MAG: hypothetical protein RR356_03885 [Bacteroidales bacterium]